MSNHALYFLYIIDPNGKFYLEGINLVVCDVGVVGREMNSGFISQRAPFTQNSRFPFNHLYSLHYALFKQELLKA